MDEGRAVRAGRRFQRLAKAGHLLFGTALVLAAQLILWPSRSEAHASEPAAASAAAGVDELLSRQYALDPERDLEAAGKEVRHLLDMRMTAHQPLADITKLKKLMVHALLSHDRRTYYCNKLTDVWSMEENGFGRALAVCTRNIDQTQDMCVVFRYRTPALQRLMHKYSRIYRDDRLELGSADIGYWLGLLKCEAPGSEKPPTQEISYLSDLLGDFATRRLDGVEPLDRKRNHEVAEFNEVTMGRYYNVLRNGCSYHWRRAAGLLRAMECSAAGLVD